MVPKDRVHPDVVPTLASVWRVASGIDLTDDTLEWPPDLFALTEVILDRSEAFRFVVSPPTGRSWPVDDASRWSQTVTVAAGEWVAWIEHRQGPPPDVIGSEWKVIREGADVPLEEVASGRAWHLCEALLTLHAVADECCAGLAGATDAHRPAGCVYRAWGRELLARTGSLARVAPHHLRVFPKLGTPTGGISLRSLSRYACICPAGVEPRWHKVPVRLPEDQPSGQRANILLLPWPLQVRGNDFRPLPNSIRREDKEPFGFFQFLPREPTDLDLVDSLVAAALDEVDTVDMVALPEGAVHESELGDLETLLHRRGVRSLIAGVRAGADEQRDFPGNWMHLGVGIGDRWWHYRQNKHHRWSLDQRQIDQYHLGAALHPSVRWWEAMDVPQRSVQFLELGDGITFAFLVCEDLARLDVVAELLRAVGPTLVMTVLLDGPQLASRWTARYASVLADDPGSAVLTLTSYGMVQRCRPAGAEPSRVVALWKDPSRGLREISLEEGSQAVLLTACTDRRARHSADGRWPIDNTATIFGAGIHQVQSSGRTAPQPVQEQDPRRTADFLDVAELTILISWAEAAAEALVSAPDSLPRLLTDARDGAQWRARLGIDEPSPQLAAAIGALSDVLSLEGHTGPSMSVATMLSATEMDQPARSEHEWLARQVLRSAIGSRWNETQRTAQRAVP